MKKNRNRSPEEKEYLKASDTVTKSISVFFTVAWILLGCLTVGLYVIKYISAIFCISLAVTVVWCSAGAFILRRLIKKHDALREKAKSCEPSEDAPPMFRELYDTYEYDQFESLTQNEFFRKWKLNEIYDYNGIISLIFIKKHHEIAVEIDESEISIIIDEETDTPAETVLNISDYNSVNAIYDAITSFCRDAVSEKEKKQ